jgi:hypothetical protein
MSARVPSSESRIDERFAIEATAIGPQSLVPGVVPITTRDRLLWRAAAPLAPKKPQRGCDHGLFDLAARDQFDLFRARQPSSEAAQRPAQASTSTKDH